MRILITRPAEDGAGIAARLAAMGHDGIVGPVLVPRYDEGPVPDLSGVQALLITSANGVRALIHRMGGSGSKDFLNIPVFAVGPQTTSRALDAGFTTVRNADGDVWDLVARTRQWAAPDKGDLLHICSREAPGTLVTQLTQAGFRARAVPLYRIEAAQSLPDTVICALRQGRVDAVMFFSPHSAAIFRDLLTRQDAGLSAPLTALCISAKTAAALAPLTFADVRVAARPNQDAMLALVA